MSQTLGRNKCNYLRLLYAKGRGCNTYVGPFNNWEKTHADVIRQIRHKTPKNSANNNECLTSSPRILLQHGNQIISAMSKNHLARQGLNSKSLDTKLAPLSLTYFKEERNLEIWNLSGYDNGMTCTTDTYARPCNEREGGVLEEKRHKIYDVKKEALKALNVQELDRLFQVSIWTAKDRTEKHTEIIKNVSFGSLRSQIAVYLAEIIDLPRKWIHFMLRELDSIFRKEAEGLPTGTSRRDEKITKSENKPNINGKSSIQKGTMYFSDLSEPPPRRNESQKDDNRPNLDTLTKAKDYFVEKIPSYISKSPDARIFRQDVVVQNNFPDKPQVIAGSANIVFQTLKLRCKTSSRYSQMGLQIRSATINEEEGSICLHWQFNGILFKWTKIFKIWKWIPKLSFSSTREENKETFEGLTTVYLDKNGQVYKVRIDKIVLDPFVEVEKKQTLVEKLAMGGNPA